jgi:hypothetical protein
MERTAQKTYILEIELPMRLLEKWGVFWVCQTDNETDSRNDRQQTFLRTLRSETAVLVSTHHFRFKKRGEVMTSLKFWDSIIHGEYMYQSHFTRMPRSEYTLLHFLSESHEYKYSDLIILHIAMIFLTCCFSRKHRQICEQSFCQICVFAYTPISTINF